MRKYGEKETSYGGFSYQNSDDSSKPEPQETKPTKAKKLKLPSEGGSLFGKSSSSSSSGGKVYGYSESTPLAKAASTAYTAPPPSSWQGIGSAAKTASTLSSSTGGGLAAAAASSGSYGSDVTPSMNKQSNPQTSHVGTIKANYYQTARTQQNQPGENEPWFFSVVTEMLKFIYEKLNFQELAHLMQPNDKREKNNGIYSSPKLVLTAETEEKLKQFQDFVTLPYDPEKEMHERLLYQLFCLCFDFDAVTTVQGDASAKPHVAFKKWKKLYHHSDLWKHIGFQQKKPESDFRGCGVFGLKNLVYFGKNHPHRFQQQLGSATTAASWNENGELVDNPEATSPSGKAIPYPFVIASLNVTMMLFDILGCGMNSSKCSNMTARKRMIDLICRGNYDSRIAEEEDDGKEASAFSDDKTPTEQKHGTILDFGDVDIGAVPDSPPIVAQDSSPVPSAEGEKKKKKKKARSSNKLVKEKNNYVFEELYVASFKLLDKYWYKAGRNRDETKIFAFNTVLEETRGEIEELLEDTFLSVDDIIVYNKTEHEE